MVKTQNATEHEKKSQCKILGILKYFTLRPELLEAKLDLI